MKKLTVTGESARSATDRPDCALGAPTLGELDAEIAADAQDQSANPDTLALITTRAEELLQYRLELAQLTLKQDELGKKIRTLQQETLPNLMDEAGVKVLGLEGDLQLVRGEQLYASISKANEKAAVDWLIENNFGALVKARILVTVEKGDTDILQATRQALAGAKVGYEETSGVHAATLKSFVKERLAASLPLPPSITYHVQPEVEVKQVKVKVHKSKSKVLI